MNSINIPKVPLQALDKLSEASSACIERLQLYDLERPDLSVSRLSFKSYQMKPTVLLIQLRKVSL
jgi:hypothetical protein